MTGYSGYNITHKALDIANGDGYYAIAVAVVLLAVRDARRGNQDALKWLQRDAGDYLEWLGIEQDAWCERVETLSRAA